MLFHSWSFVLFFLIVYAIYFPLRGTRFYLPWLLVASYVFYAWWNPLYLLLIGYATLVNYLAAARMERSSRRELWLTFAAVNSLALLGFFKYSVFVAENVNALLALLGLSWTVPEPGMLFPVGISFYTFQAMGYTIDCYRGTIERERSLLRFAAFVALFPRLLAGPIERAGNVLPQLARKPGITRTHLTDGASLFLVGLFKKVALADYLKLYVDSIYEAPALAGSPALLLATFAFAWQIYFDFSGYTDMARGIARMMGFNLMLNFDNPYLATSLGDFWRRWHISLSFWFRDYLYIPLGGNRKGTFNTYRNIFITMVVSGLWHGAAWTFAIWGALHALGRFMTRELERTAFYRDRIPKFAKQLYVFVFVMFAWIFFRANSLSDAWVVVKGIFRGAWVDPQVPLLAMFLCLCVWLYQFLFESCFKQTLAWTPVRVGLACFLILYLILFAGASHEAFIYLQF